MPLFDYICENCGKTSELLVKGSDTDLKCRFCNSSNIKKLLSAPSSLSGPVRSSFPGPGDTACCGSSPSLASDCSGPGS